MSTEINLELTHLAYHTLLSKCFYLISTSIENSFIIFI